MTTEYTRRDHKRRDFEKDAKRYLERVGKRYVYDSSSELYKNEASKAQGSSPKKAADNSKRKPFWVDVRRNWLVLIISALTLLLLVLTVRYAHMQWFEAQRTADAATKALKLSAAANGVASEAFKLSADQFQLANRAYLSVETPITLLL